MSMNKYLIAAAAVLITSTSAMAAPYGNGKGPRALNGFERAAIAQSQANLNVLKRQARADGRVTFYERTRIRFAEIRHNNLVQRYRFN